MSSTFFTLKQRIMWRVYTIWAARAALSRTALKVYILAVILWKSTEYVSYTNVWDNAPNITNVAGNVQFLGGALSQTETTNAVLFLGLLILFAWIVFDLVPALRRKTGQSSPNIEI